MSYWYFSISNCSWYSLTAHVNIMLQNESNCKQKDITFPWYIQSRPHASLDHNTIYLHCKYSTYQNTFQINIWDLHFVLVTHSFSSKQITFYTVTLMQGSYKVALQVNECELTLHLPAKLPCTFPTPNFVKIHSVRKETCGRTLPFTCYKECMANSKSKQVFRPQNTQVAVCLLHWWYFIAVSDGLEMLMHWTTNFPHNTTIYEQDFVSWNKRKVSTTEIHFRCSCNL